MMKLQHKPLLQSHKFFKESEAKLDQLYYRKDAWSKGVGQNASPLAEIKAAFISIKGGGRHMEKDLH